MAYKSYFNMKCKAILSHTVNSSGKVNGYTCAGSIEIRTSAHSIYFCPFNSGCTHEEEPPICARESHEDSKNSVPDSLLNIEILTITWIVTMVSDFSSPICGLRPVAKTACQLLANKHIYNDHLHEPSCESQSCSLLCMALVAYLAASQSSPKICHSVSNASLQQNLVQSHPLCRLQRASTSYGTVMQL